MAMGGCVLSNSYCMPEHGRNETFMEVYKEHKGNFAIAARFARIRAIGTIYGTVELSQ